MQNIFIPLGTRDPWHPGLPYNGCPSVRVSGSTTLTACLAITSDTRCRRHIEIVDLPTKDGDFPVQDVSQPEGTIHHQLFDGRAQGSQGCWSSYWLSYWPIPSGCVNSLLLKMAIEIVDLRIDSMVTFHSYVNVYQRVPSYWFRTSTLRCPAHPLSGRCMSARRKCKGLVDVPNILHPHQREKDQAKGAPKPVVNIIQNQVVVNHFEPCQSAINLSGYHKVVFII